MKWLWTRIIFVDLGIRNVMHALRVSQLFLRTGVTVIFIETDSSTFVRDKTYAVCGILARCSFEKLAGMYGSQPRKIPVIIGCFLQFKAPVNLLELLDLLEYEVEVAYLHLVARCGGLANFRFKFLLTIVNCGYDILPV